MSTVAKKRVACQSCTIETGSDHAHFRAIHNPFSSDFQVGCRGGATGLPSGKTTLETGERVKGKKAPAKQSDMKIR